MPVPVFALSSNREPNQLLSRTGAEPWGGGAAAAVGRPNTGREQKAQVAKWRSPRSSFRARSYMARGLLLLISPRIVPALGLFPFPRGLRRCDVGIVAQALAHGFYRALVSTQRQSRGGPCALQHHRPLLIMHARDQFIIVCG